MRKSILFIAVIAMSFLAFTYSDGISNEAMDPDVYGFVSGPGTSGQNATVVLSGNGVYTYVSTNSNCYYEIPTSLLNGTGIYNIQVQGSYNGSYYCASKTIKYISPGNHQVGTITLSYSGQWGCL